MKNFWPDDIKGAVSLTFDDGIVTQESDCGPLWVARKAKLVRMRGQLQVQRFFGSFSEVNGRRDRLEALSAELDRLGTGSTFDR